jgi:hypothetical protein
MLDNGTYEVEHNEHQVANATDTDQIAKGLTTWLANRT